MIPIKESIRFFLSLIFILLLPLSPGLLFAQATSGIEKRETKIEGNSVVTEVTKSPKDFPYTAIAEKNIFSPERKEFPLMVQPGPAGEVKKTTPRPQLILYGITIAEDYQSATLSNPGGPLRKGGREIITLKEGEKLGEYKLAKILPDRVIMDSGEDSFEVLLDDPRSPKKRISVRTEVRPATVSSTAASTPPGPPPAPAAPAPTAPPPVTPAPERVVPASPTVPTTPTYPLRPGRGRFPFSPPQEIPVPTTPSEVSPMTPIDPTPIPPPTSVPVPMTPRSIPVAPPTPIPVTPGGPTPQGSGGQ